MHFFTSDTHIGHTSVMRHDQPMPFATQQEREQAIVDRHNAVVGDNDDVWHLGDVAWKVENLKWYLSQVRGRIHLIRGNHDDDVAWKHRQLFASHREAHYLRANGLRVYLSHYAHRVWRNSSHGSYHLFGHSHGDMPPEGRSFDVGVHAQNYTPVSLEQVHNTLKEVPYRNQNHHPSHAE